MEREDYEEADTLNMRILQTKNVIAAKDTQIKRLDEEYMGVERRKGEREKELRALVKRSLERLGEMRERQQEEMLQFEETELNAIEEKRKRLHYESIRVEEIRKEMKAQREGVDAKMAQIEEMVYEETRPEQEEKEMLRGRIDRVDAEIRDIEDMLERKRREREMLVGEKDKLEREIDKGRG